MTDLMAGPDEQPQVTVSSGSGDWRRVEDGAPGCLPGFRPDRVRSDRASAFLYGHAATAPPQMAGHAAHQGTMQP
jgi:hypothetical protein